MCNFKVSNLISLSLNFLKYKDEDNNGICEDTINYSNYNLIRVYECIYVSANMWVSYED